MRLRVLSIVPALALLVAARPGGAKPAQPAVSDLVVHEWGTFLAMQGSDGVTLDGMYHEEHALPAFVHARSRDQLHLPSVILKGETPVIYFYTGRPQRVQVAVRFPHGIWTQWYPQAGVVGPPLTVSGSPPELRDGRILWCADVIPSLGAEQGAALPAAEPGALWNYAREVDAAYVRTVNRVHRDDRNEYERFIFYRGLGQAPLPMQATSIHGGTLTWSRSATGDARHVFVLRVENGRGAYRYVPSLAPGESIDGITPSMSESLPMPEFTRRVGDDLAARLKEGGLYLKEARAMVNTWSSSYFRTDGLRVLFVLPQRWTDEFIPLQILPQPKQVVRVMVGRVEMLTPQRERLAEQAVRQLGSSDAVARKKAFEYLRDQGRYVEPVLRRVLRTTQDEQARTLCKRLMLTDFVTELRTALQSPINGERITEDPVHVRAQLALLLKEIGLADEAKAEAEQVRAALSLTPAPPIKEEEAGHYLRASARAAEAMGDNENAAESYGKLVRFGSQLKSDSGCVSCHRGFGNGGPREMVWFHDWWVGRRLAGLLEREGRLDAEIGRYEAALASNSDDTAAQMVLAYLYAATGKRDAAARMWAKVEARPRVAARTE
jgi:tetratricopeptide (TPR) repeat protein